MAMKPVSRPEASDLEVARKIVSRAERRALERAEQLRAEADELLKLVSSQAVDAEVKVRAEFDAQSRALREEMAEASRRATVAENELELLRARTDGARTELVTTPIDDPAQAERLTAAAAATAAQIRAQAELELARAREEAVGLLASASREAGELLSSAMAAVENDTAATEAVRAQLEEELRAAAAVRSELDVALGQATQDAARIREDGIVTRDRVVDDAIAEAARILEAARAEAGRIRESSGPDVDNARAEADRLVAEARREAADALNAVRCQLISEILGLRDAMEKARQSFAQFVESAEPASASSDRVVGGW